MMPRSQEGSADRVSALELVVRRRWRSPDILMAAGDRATGDFMREAETMPVQERDSLKRLGEITNLKGMFGRPSRPVSIEDLNAAIARRGARKK